MDPVLDADAPHLPPTVVHVLKRWCRLADLVALRLVCRMWAACIGQHAITVLHAPAPPGTVTGDLARMAAAFPLATTLCVSPGALQGIPSSFISHVTCLVVESSMRDSQTSQPMFGQLLFSARTLVGMHKLRHVVVRECMLVQEALDGFIMLRNLTKLDLSNCLEVNNKVITLLPKLPSLRELHLPAPISHAPRLNQCTPQGLHMLVPSLPNLSALHLITPNLELHGRDTVRFSGPSPASHPTLIKGIALRGRLAALSLHALAEVEAKTTHSPTFSARVSGNGLTGARSGTSDFAVSAHGIVLQLPSPGPVASSLAYLTELTQLTHLSLSPHVQHSYSDGGLSQAASMRSLAELADAYTAGAVLVSGGASPLTSPHASLHGGIGAIATLSATVAPPLQPSQHSSGHNSLTGGTVPTLSAAPGARGAIAAAAMQTSGTMHDAAATGSALTVTPGLDDVPHVGSVEFTPPQSPLPNLSRSSVAALTLTSARLGMLIGDFLVDQLCCALHRLAVLELKDCWELGVGALASIAQHLPVLTDLDLTGSCRTLPASELTQLAPLTALKRLSLSRWGAPGWRPPFTWRVELLQREQHALVGEDRDSEDEDDDGEEDEEGVVEGEAGSYNLGPALTDSTNALGLDAEVLSRLASKLGLTQSGVGGAGSSRVSGSGVSGARQSGSLALNTGLHQAGAGVIQEFLCEAEEFEMPEFQGFDSQVGTHHTPVPNLVAAASASVPAGSPLQRMLVERARARLGSTDTISHLGLTGGVPMETVGSLSLGSNVHMAGEGAASPLSGMVSSYVYGTCVEPGSEGMGVALCPQPSSPSLLGASEEAPETPTIGRPWGRAAADAETEADLGSALAALERPEHAPRVPATAAGCRQAQALGSPAGGQVEARVDAPCSDIVEPSSGVSLTSVFNANLSATSLVVSDNPMGSPFSCRQLSATGLQPKWQVGATRLSEVSAESHMGLAYDNSTNNSNASAAAAAAVDNMSRHESVSSVTAAVPVEVLDALRRALARQRRRQKGARSTTASRDDLLALGHVSNLAELEQVDPLAAALARVSSQHPQLTELNLGGWEGVSAEALYCLAAGPSGCSSLRVLRLTGCHWLRARHVTALTAANQLRELDISYTLPRPRALEAMGALQRLQTLEMEGCQASWEATRSVCALIQRQGIRVLHFTHPDTAATSVQGLRLGPAYGAMGPNTGGQPRSSYTGKARPNSKQASLNLMADMGLGG